MDATGLTFVILRSCHFRRIFVPDESKPCSDHLLRDPSDFP